MHELRYEGYLLGGMLEYLKEPAHKYHENGQQDYR